MSDVQLAVRKTVQVSVVGEVWIVTPSQILAILTYVTNFW